MLNGIDSAIHHLDHLIQRYKRRLQTGQLHQRLHRPPIRLPTLLHLLPALPQTCQAKIILGVAGGEGFELRQEDAGYILLLGAEPEARHFGRLLDLIGDAATADGVGHFGEGEGGDLHDAAHLSLSFVDAARDF